MEEITKNLIKKIEENTKETKKDKILFKDNKIPIKENNFEKINAKKGKEFCFIDGGQTNLVKTPNLIVQFIRLYGCIFKNKGKEHFLNEFYLIVDTEYDNELKYNISILERKSNIKIKDKLDNLEFYDSKINKGNNRGDIEKASNLIRRIGELTYAKELSKKADHVILDGTLDQKHPIEKRILEESSDNISALAKTSKILTTKGRSAPALINQIGLEESSWMYKLLEDENFTTYFVKLHPKSDYVFRLDTLKKEEGKDIISGLASESTDPTFLGYPYGLIWVDKKARVHNKMASIEKTRILSNIEEREQLEKYLNAENAHDILDNIR